MHRLKIKPRTVPDMPRCAPCCAVACLWLLSLAAVSPVGAQEAETQEAETQEAGTQEAGANDALGGLLEGLDLPSPAAPNPSTPPARPDTPSPSELPAGREESAAEGSSQPDASAAMPLLEAYRSMQAARELLAQGETGEATRAAQRRAVDLLDQMIQAASPPPSTTSPQPQPAPGEPGSSASGQPEAGQPPSEQQRPGDEGDEEPGGAESEQEGSASGGPGQPAGTVPAAGAGTARGIRPDGAGAAVWGHLPERTRGMLRSEMPTEYLPQYATEISEYFRQLAEMKPDE